MKKMRMITTAILLFQNCLFTATAFAEESPVEIDTELVQSLQEQTEIPVTESSPMVEAAEAEPEQTVSDEPSGSEDLNQLQPEPDTGSESTDSVDSTVVPETADSTETSETTQTQEPVLVEENKEEVGTPSETPTEEVHNKMMVLPSFMRMSAYSLPNLNQYRPYLTSNGESSYIQRVMQSATNRSVTLGAEVGATASFTTSFATNSMVRGDGSDWIAYISSDKALPEAYFTQMYYGNHSSFNNTYSLNNLRGSGVPSYIQVTPTVTSISNYRVTLSVTIRRTAATTSNSDQFNLLGNLTLGTTAVAPVVNNYSKNIENVNYQNAVIGNITVNNEQPSATIKNSVIVEATRNNLSQDTIKSWFSTLPANVNDYTFSVSGPSNWAPGLKGTATVTMRHNSSGASTTFTTQYEVRDTQAPTGTVKTSGVEIEARRTGSWTRADLMKFIDGNLSDNWSTSDNIRFEIINSEGIFEIEGKAPGNYAAYVDLYDEAGNKLGGQYANFKVVDTQAPTGTVKNEVIGVEARRSGNLSQEELRQFVQTSSDNWTLSENIKLNLLGSNGGSMPIANISPGSTYVSTYFLQMEDEAGNKSSLMAVKLRIVDTQAPTGTVKNEVIDVEARRSGNLSQAELRQFVQTSSDNWTLSEKIKLNLVSQQGMSISVAGRIPGASFLNTYYLQLEDEAGNKSTPMLIKLRIVDTQAPTGTVKTNGVEIEARRTGSWTRTDLLKFIDGDLADNWSMADDIRFEIINSQGIFDIEGKAPGNYAAYVDLYDEAGNMLGGQYANFKVVDTQAPTGTVKNEVIDVEARRSGNLSQAELRQFVQTSSDNWTLSENIKLNLVNSNGSAISIAGLLNTQNLFLQMEDEAGNKSNPMLIKMYIVDTQAPTATVKTKGVEIEARRSGGWTRKDLLKFVDGDLKDNWSLAENIRIEATDNNGIFQIEGKAPGNYWAYLDIYDEAGNKYGNYVEFKIVDTQAPTGKVKTNGVEIEARRTGSWTRTDLLKFIDGDLADNWSMADDIRFEIINNEGIFDIEGKSPGSYGAYVDLFDEAGNMLGGQYSIFKVVDTQAPTGTLRTTIPNFEYRTQGDWTREELLTFFDGRLSDNWSDHEAITLGMDRLINQFPPSTGVQQATLTLTDEAGNKQQYPVQFYLTAFAIQPNVMIQAQRAPSLPTKTILSWFDGLSDPVEDYYEFSMPESVGGWAPGKTGQAEVTIRNKETNGIQQQTTNYTVVDTEAPEGVIKKDRLIMEADRTRNFTQDELRLFFDGLSDNWSVLENINLKSSNKLSSLSPNTGNYHYVLHIKAMDEEGNSRDFASALVRIEDTLPPTATVNGEMTDIEARRTGGLEREDLLRLVKADLSDNWSLPDQISMKVVVPQGNSYVEANINQAPGTVITGYLQLIDEAGNQTLPGPANQVSLRITDTQAPEFTTTRGTALEARREGDLSQEELRELVDTMSDNWSLPEHLNISLVDGEGNPSNIHGIAPGDGSVHTQKFIQLSDETGNKTAPQEVWVYTVDTTPPVAVMKNETIKIEAQRDWTMTREELMLFTESITDNWDILDDIELELVDSNGNRETIGGRAPGQIFHAYLRLSDRKGNQATYPIAMELVDTQGPQGTLKNDLSFNKGSTEPDARDYLDGEPTDNWTKPEDIAVSVVYENGAQFEELKVGNHEFVLTLTDEQGNKTELKGQLTIKDNKKQYVDVTIPVRLSFAESKESGGIVSPTYQIQNNSEHDLAVSVASMTSKGQTEKLTDMNLSMSNNYNDTTIPLIKDGKNLSQETEWLTLPKKTHSFAFSLQGTVGKNFDFDSLADPLRPQYSLQFHFGVY